MKYEDINIDERYKVSWLDPNYPCSCTCHDFPHTKKHILPCCYDNSYTGMATCVKKDDKTKIIEFLIDKKIGGSWYLRIFAEDVLDKMEM